MGTGSLPGVKCGQGMLLTTHPLLVPRSWKKSRAITLPTLWATPDLHGNEITLSFKITLFVHENKISFADKTFNNTG